MAPEIFALYARPRPARQPPGRATWACIPHDSRNAHSGRRWRPHARVPARHRRRLAAFGAIYRVLTHASRPAGPSLTGRSPSSATARSPRACAITALAFDGPIVRLQPPPGRISERPLRRSGEPRSPAPPHLAARNRPYRSRSRFEPGRGHRFPALRASSAAAGTAPRSPDGPRPCCARGRARR
jgi:hypothetical protein